MVGRDCLLSDAETFMGKPRQKQETGGARKSALNAVKSRPEKSQKTKNTAPKKHKPTETISSPQTCCSNCQTVFEVSPELLSTSDTRVRCGECLSIFDALSNLRDLSVDGDSTLAHDRNEGVQGSSVISEDAQSMAEQLDNDKASLPNASAAALAGLSNDTSSLDVTYSDFDLFSSDAGLPDIQFSDSTRDIRDFHFDDVTDIDDETFSDTLFAQDATINAPSLAGHTSDNQNASGVALGADVGFLHDDSRTEPLIFNYPDTAADEPLREGLNAGAGAATRAGKATSHASQSSVTQPVAEIFDDKLEFDEPSAAINASEAEIDLRMPEAAPSSWLLRSGLFAIVIAIAGGLYGYRDRDKLLNNSVLRPLLSSVCGLLSCELPNQIDLEALRAVDRSVVLHPTVAKALIIKFGIINQASFSQPYPVLEIRLTDRAGRLVVINRFLPSEYSRGWQEGDVLDMGKRLDVGLAVEDPGRTAMSFELDFYEVK
jgi:predicted Zn finger-like uncharacterized protein